MNLQDKIRATKTLINSKIAIGISPVEACREWGNLILELHNESIKRAEELLFKINICQTK